MKKYISLAAALFLGTVVASTKKTAVSHSSIAAARKTTVAHAKHHAHHTLVKVVHKKKAVETSVTTLADEVSSNETNERADITSVTSKDGDLTSNHTITSVNDVRAATSVTTKDGDISSPETEARVDSVTTDDEWSSNKTSTSVDDVKSWWDKKDARVSSWWDTKNARVASPWWDSKKKVRNHHKKAVNTPKVKRHVPTCGAYNFFGVGPCFDSQVGYVVPCGQISLNHYHCCMTVALPCTGAHKNWYVNPADRERAERENYEPYCVGAGCT